jgi:hypothetical protein
MLMRIEVLSFEEGSVREPTKLTAVVNSDEIVYIEPALWNVTRWSEGKHCVWITLKTGKEICAFGRPEDFVSSDK